MPRGVSRAPRGGKAIRVGNDDDAGDAAATATAEPRQETETEINTRLNALIYHTSDETVDLYRRENDSSDLLGRLYYDDYDSESVTSEVSTPGSEAAAGSAGGTSADYFGGSINAALMAEGHKPVEPGRAGPLAALGPLGSHSVPNLEALAELHGRVASPDGRGRWTGGLGARSSSASRRPAVQRLASFERGVSFDNLSDAHRRSLTFKVKHPQYKFRRNNKTYLTGYSGDEESRRSIEWLFEQMVVHGDTVIVLQVLDEKQHRSIDKARANESLRQIELLNRHGKKVSVVFEVVIGKAQRLLQAAIDEYNPQMMVIGTHTYEDRDGRMHEHHKGFLSKSSMSRHFLECALVPVIVVKPCYEYVERLAEPIDGEEYFARWIARSDLAWTYSREKNARRRAKGAAGELCEPGEIPAQNETRRGRGDDGEAGRGRGDDGEAGRGRGDDERVRLDVSRSRSRSRSRTGLRNLFTRQ
ncbi:UspA domain-containing protein [[Candida] zeylanoides]